MKRTTTDGLWRFTKHFGYWFVGVDLAFSIPAWLGVPFIILVPLSWITGIVVPLLLVIAEIEQTINSKQTIGKAVVDFIAKSGGFATGILTWTFWFR